MKQDAAPGPDGLNVAFYRAAWPWLGDDIVQLIHSFYETGNLPPQLNKTFIVLIPKKSVSIKPEDFRPISLCNVIYKIISKSLAQRIKPHLPHSIHKAQSAFIPGRHITSNIIIAQEITHSFILSSWNQKGFMLKIDLAKAFDKLNWNFILKALLALGFNHTLTNRIAACIIGTSLSVLVNGQPHTTFFPSTGIRQGCPLSPYLFVIAINELSKMLQAALHNSSLLGITLGPHCPQIHSLLKNVDTPTRIHIKNIFPVQNLTASTTHLGHPLIFSHKDRSAAYSFLKHKFIAKLNTIKANKLSHAGRLTYINSVLASIPIYYMTNILFPKKFINQLNSILMKFWWAGIQEENAKPFHFRAWEDLTTPKSQGGLGIRNLHAVNQSLVLHSTWMIASQKDPFLHKVIKSKYFLNTTFWKAPNNTPKSVFWSSILKIKHHLHNNCTFQIHAGNTNIWTEPWCTNWKNIHNHLLIPITQPTLPNTVSDLWDSETEHWNISLASHTFDPIITNQIASLRRVLYPSGQTVYPNKMVYNKL
ncbi:hypothetical protein U9M48_016730 [Paspalum notatum var. saurae]|uniref:Reverse transcriptase domain-containing protein n=1 Tax=Paspalum notatum var. saurae TaxID=547442 RepID=A0AAQ3T6S2_PASNO